MTDTKLHDNGDYTFQVNGDHATIHTAFFIPRYVTPKFEDTELTYRAGIDSEIKAITDNYTDVTPQFESRLNDEYYFHGDETSPAEWFHKADFWKYTFDSSDNIFHYIRYAATHVGENGVTNEPINPEPSYPFPEDQVFTYFDPDDQRARVFAASSTDAKPALDVARHVFQPRLTLYATKHNGHLTDSDKNVTPLRFTVTAEPSALQNSVDQSLTTLQDGYIAGGRILELSNLASIHSEPVPATTEVTGDLWDILCAISRQEEPWTNSVIKPAQNDSFSPYRLFITSQQDNYERSL